MEVINQPVQLAKEPAAAIDQLRYPPSPAATVTDHPSTRTNTGTSTPDTSSEVGPTCEIDARAANPSCSYPLAPKSRASNKVLTQDADTPDAHVVRDSRLIRLTGIHPFNTEAPLSDLYNEGFITTKDLHYVRNHGPVPNAEEQNIYDWEFTVEGMVEKPFKLSLQNLIDEFQQVTYPVTLVCAGNRRKEQNIVRKSRGFSWGPAGLSTALWTGVPLPELLRRAGVRRGAKYVYFEGDEKLPNGQYGTSEKLNWAMDANKGFLIAHKMNGEILHPDHGKPVRVVIPGQIGGRSVKWLRKIVVTDRPSDNWYHIYDNRVLPTTVTPEASDSLPNTWKDERYAIYDLNTNSATAYPAHNEVLSLDNTQGDTYNVRGYAYSGGGKRVTRVEITLDKGRTWKLANIKYPEDEYRNAREGEMLYGGLLDMSWRESCFCWCFWDLDIPMSEIASCDDIMVRAMDDSMMVQPRDMYWSVLGMMNNPWFRIVVHKEAHNLRFEHPTQPALMPGGWMERVKKAGGKITNGFWGEKIGEEEEEVEEPAKEICMTKADVTRLVTIDELRKHDGKDEPWFVVNSQVYDGTPFLEGHPGGAASIFGAAGQDATEEFMTIHSENAKKMMPEYHIGSLDEAAQKIIAEGEPEVETDEPREVFLQNKSWSKGVLSQKTKISADTKIFTFDLEHADQVLGLPVGQHLMVRLRDQASKDVVIRAYTPISEGSAKGKLDVLVKIYFDSPERKGGKMTQALDSVPVGQSVDFKGPIGKFEYLGKGLCTISGKERKVNRFIMICAGSGVTPIFQVLRAVMKDNDDPTKCLVLDGNRVESDILLRKELDSLAVRNPERCDLLHTLTRPEAHWGGLRGRMGKELFEERIGACSEVGGDDLILICGPEAMEKSTHSTLHSLGWVDEDLLFF
ncbi:hypothetical protein MKZ38_008152 [Zalerion maritima]|uniref:Nitrate reductase n=1 Tax=Zalerion maritima TaxID=339359 RepID=A0AAD5RUF0_9PEZI|nr:hypothetical protein MKZ38_008152 [Zalerion maritima]